MMIFDEKYFHVRRRSRHPAPPPLASSRASAAPLRRSCCMGSGMHRIAANIPITGHSPGMSWPVAMSPAMTTSTPLFHIA